MTRVDDRTNQLAALDLFAGCTPRELQQALSFFTPIRVPAGTTFIHEGGIGAEYFVIVSGTARVERQGELIARIEAGNGVGEIALISDHHRRNADVIAETDVDTLVANRREFASLIDAVPNVARRILGGAVSRLADPQPA